MFRIEHIEFFWALAAVPLFVFLFIMKQGWRKKAILLFGDFHLVKQLMPDVSTGKPLIKLILFSLAYVFLVIALANPQIGSKMEEMKREGVDIIIALDVSNSMMAEDLSPSRLGRAKMAIAQLIDKLKNDRLGIIIFGGQAYVQLPVTMDYAAAKMFLSSINTRMVPTQGTAIGAAIELSVSSFDFNSATSKTIIVITDGENHEDDAAGASGEAANKGITVHTIGMGSAQGSPIPIYKSNKQVDFRKDKEGNTVVTKLNETMLQEIAAAGNGMYVRASNAQSGIDLVLSEVNKMEKVEFGTKVYTDYEDRFQYFIAAALLLLVLEFLISGRKSKWLSAIRVFGEPRLSRDSRNTRLSRSSEPAGRDKA